MPEKLHDYYVVKEHPVRIISKCKAHSKGTLLSFLVGICIIYALLNWIPELVSLKLPVTNVDLISNLNGIDKDMLLRMPRTPVIIYIYALMFSGVFKLGEALYTLTYIRNKRVEYRALFEGFNLYVKTLGVFVLQVIIVAFWSMFFVIPGIIASINFSQAFYVMADDPSKSVTEILSESKMLMVGNRLSYIRLLIYYLPYLMIAYIPSLLLSDLVMRYDFSSLTVLVIAMLAEIPVFAANGYLCLGRAVFYELMINKGFAYFKYAGQDTFRQLESKDPY